MKIDIKKAHRSVIIIAAAIIVFAIFIGAVFIYTPFKNATKELESKISVEKNKNALIGKINILGRNLEGYRKKIAEKEDPSWLSKEISRIVSEEGIEVSSVEPGVVEKRDLYTKLDVTLDVYATYHQLGAFLSRIESEDRFFRVGSLNMKRLDLDEDFENLAERFKPFDVKANIVVTTVVLR